MSRFAILIFIALFIPATMSAELQESVKVELVDVYVSALDSEGNPVEDLNDSDFILKEDGVQQHLTYFTRLLDEESQIVLTVALLLDTSGSMGKGSNKLRRFDIAQNFASLFMKEVKRGDQMQLIGFDNVYRPLTPMTSKFEIVQQALATMKLDSQRSPGTGLLASIDLTIRKFSDYFGRKILIICSDGQNNIPGPTVDTLIERLKRQDIAVFSLTTVNREDQDQSNTQANQIEGPGQSINSLNVQSGKTMEAKNARKLMLKLAEETGGYAFFFKDDSNLAPAIDRIRSIIRSQYALAYKPDSNVRSKNAWRKIEVKCLKKGIKLHYREGYFAD